MHFEQKFRNKVFNFKRKSIYTGLVAQNYFGYNTKSTLTSHFI